MSELPEGIEPAPIPEPKESALGIVLRRRDGALTVLLGRRSRHSRFMPGNLVFPGGKLDTDDDPARPGAYERCASRELLEEAGLDIAPGAWIAAGERTTPPIFPMRFRTFFFVAEHSEGATLPASPPSPDELETLDFIEPSVVLADWEAGRSSVPPPILPILRLLDTMSSAAADVLAARIAAINAEEDANPRIEFVPRVWVLPVRTRTLPPASCTNVWMPGGRRFVVVDPGSSEPGENARLLAVVARRVAQGDAVEAIVLTHHHRDHVGGVHAIATALRVPVWAHADTFARIPALPGAVPVRELVDGDAIDLAGMTLHVVHTPGHAPGHLALFDAELRMLVAGDLVSGLSTILVGLADGDMDAYLDSLRRTAALDPRTVLPSHGPPLPGRALTATIAHREAREAAIVAAIGDRPGADLPSIAALVYEATPDVPPFLRELQTRAHLDRLVRHGRVARVANGYRV